MIYEEFAFGGTFDSTSIDSRDYKKQIQSTIKLARTMSFGCSRAAKMIRPALMPTWRGSTRVLSLGL